jgi:hypothetical protein
MTVFCQKLILFPLRPLAHREPRRNPRVALLAVVQPARERDEPSSVRGYHPLASLRAFAQSFGVGIGDEPNRW